MRRLAGIVAVCLTIGSSLSACSGGASAGNPIRGGTLNMLGTGDVDYMDPNVSYYTTGYLGLRMWSRQLLTYPAVAGRTTSPVPDLATQVPSRSNGGISSNGLTYKLTIRSGAMWNTSPPREVTARDVLRGVERTCNPAQPFGGLADFETLIAGMQAFCDGFAKVPPTAAAIKAFLASNSVSGIKVDSTNPLSVIFTLTRPATYFPNLLAIPALSPAPVEFLNYVPASPDLAQHTVSDGPYEIVSYTPAKSIVFARNPAWNGGTDPTRKAFVDRIVVSETETQQQVEEHLSTNSPGADMGWDSPIPTASVPAFLAAKNPRLTLGPTFGSDPYLLFDTASPNNGAALRKVEIRQALEYAINRSELIRAAGGPKVAPPLTHVLPPGVIGSQPSDPYPYDPAKARRKLGSAGTPRLHLKVLYQANLDFEARMFQIIQSELAKIDVSVTGVATNSSDFYTKYLEVPSVARNGAWDLALAQWVPDWYGNAAFSFFFPLFAGPVSFPPQGSDFGLYNNPTTSKLIHEAASTTSLSKAGSLWARADRQVMADAVIYPITSPAVPVYHAAQVHNAVFVPNLFQFDPTNVWLTPGRNGA